MDSDSSETEDVGEPKEPVAQQNARILNFVSFHHFEASS